MISKTYTTATSYDNFQFVSLGFEPRTSRTTVDNCLLFAVIATVFNINPFGPQFRTNSYSVTGQIQNQPLVFPPA